MVCTGTVPAPDPLPVAAELSLLVMEPWVVTVPLGLVGGPLVLKDSGVYGLPLAPPCPLPTLAVEGMSPP